MVRTTALQVDVALTPRGARRLRSHVCILVDQLRASSTIVTLLDLGCPTVLPVAGLEEARGTARSNGHVLAGEMGGRRPPGYDYGNSPVELSGANLHGAAVVLRTRNGTRLVQRLTNAPALLVGCLLNVGACAQVAVDLALAKGTSIGIACAGRDGDFALDDALAAGALVERLSRSPYVRDVQLSDAALATQRIWRGCRKPAEVLRASASGRLLQQLNMGRDVDACARLNRSVTVPILIPETPPRFVSAGTWASEAVSA